MLCCHFVFNHFFSPSSCSMVECIHCQRQMHRICVLHHDPIWPEGFQCANCLRALNTTLRENRFSAKRKNMLTLVFSWPCVPMRDTFMCLVPSCYMCMCFCSANFCLALTAVSLGENIVSGISICTHNAVNFACFIMQVMYWVLFLGLPVCSCPYGMLAHMQLLY